MTPPLPPHCFSASSFYFLSPLPVWKAVPKQGAVSMSLPIPIGYCCGRESHCWSATSVTFSALLGSPIHSRDYRNLALFAGLGEAEGRRWGGGEATHDPRCLCPNTFSRRCLPVAPAALPMQEDVLRE